MTNAEAQMTAYIKKLSFAQLKDVAREMNKTLTDEADIVLNFALGRLGGMMTDRDFCAFCEELADVEDSIVANSN